METFVDWLAAAVAQKLRLDVTSRFPILVSVKVAAERSGMSRRWLYDHKDEPFMRRLGPRTYRVDLDALEAWMGGDRASAGSRASLPSRL